MAFLPIPAELLDQIFEVAPNTVLWSGLQLSKYYHSFIKTQILTRNIKISQSLVATEFVSKKNYAGVDICLKYRFSFEQAMNIASSEGNLEMIKYLINLGIDWATYSFSNAAENGHLNVLIWMKNLPKSVGVRPLNKCSNWNLYNHTVDRYKTTHSNTYDNATTNNYFEIFQWLKENVGSISHCPLIDKIIFRGELEVIKRLFDPDTLLIENGVYDNNINCAIRSAIIHKQIHIFNWLIENRVDMTDVDLLYNSLIYGNLDIFKRHFDNQKTQINSNNLEVVTTHGHLHILKYVHENNNTITKTLTNIAVINAHIHILDWMKENKLGVFAVSNKIKNAIRGGIKVIEWCIKNDIKTYVDAKRITCPDLETLTWLQINNDKSEWNIFLTYDCLCYIFENAVKRNDFNIAIYMIDKGLVSVDFLFHQSNIINYLYEFAIHERRIDVIKILMDHNKLYTMSYFTRDNTIKDKNFTMLKLFLKSMDNIGPCRLTAIETAAKTGDLEIYQYLVGICCKSPILLGAIIEGGNMEMLQWTINNLRDRIILNNDETAIATKYCDMEMFDICHKLGAKINLQTLYEAIKNENIMVINLCMEENLDFNPIGSCSFNLPKYDNNIPCLLTTAIKTGNLEIMQILINMINTRYPSISGKWKTYAIDKKPRSIYPDCLSDAEYAVQNGNLEFLKFLRSNGMIFDIQSLGKAVIKKDLEIFEWMMMVIKEPSLQIVVTTAKNGEIGILDIYIKYHGIFFGNYASKIILVAVENDQNHMVKYLYSIFTDFLFSSEIITVAAKRNNLNLLTWIWQLKQTVDLSIPLTEIKFARIRKFLEERMII